MKFDWELDAEIEPDTLQVRPPYWRWLQIALLLLSLSGLAGGAWWRVRSAENALKQLVQDALDLEAAAVKSGDGEQFFTFFPNQPAFKFSQLQPINRNFYLGNPQVTRAELHEDVIWANVTYQSNGVTRQRLLFFEQAATGLRHLERDTQFWGEVERTPYRWGTLVLQEADAEWRTQFADAIQRNIDAYQNVSDDKRRNVTFAVTDTYLPLAVDVASFPTPRIWGLDVDGEPSADYWAAFDRAIISQFELEKPVTLRFAIDVSDTASGHSDQDIRFRRLKLQSVADTYMRLNPDVNIELVEATMLPADPVERMKLIDGAIMPLSADLITSGAILDLTSLLQDPALQPSDFYEQIFVGAFWQERFWQMPLTAEMRMLFYDKEMVEAAAIPPPWTFNDYANLVTTLQVQNDKHGLLLSAPDLLYAHAFAHSSDPLNRLQAAETLQWFSQLKGVQYNNQLEPFLRRQQSFTILSSNRKAATWIDVPKEYEYHSLLNSLGVAPFPATERLTSVAPLWIDGAMISSTSENPLAVWRWLLYLSYEAPKLNRRVIPARPSVAFEMEFWQNIPRPLNAVMRTAFPTARAVTVEDRRYFSADAIPANRSQPTPLYWFTP